METKFIDLKDWGKPDHDLIDLESIVRVYDSTKWCKDHSSKYVPWLRKVLDSKNSVCYSIVFKTKVCSVEESSNELEIAFSKDREEEFLSIFKRSQKVEINFSNTGRNWKSDVIDCAHQGKTLTLNDCIIKETGKGLKISSGDKSVEVTFDMMHSSTDSKIFKNGDFCKTSDADGETIYFIYRGKGGQIYTAGRGTCTDTLSDTTIDIHACWKERGEKILHRVDNWGVTEKHITHQTSEEVAKSLNFLAEHCFKWDTKNNKLVHF